MNDVSDLIKQIEKLQQQTNSATIQKQTAVIQKKNIQQEIDQLRKKSQQDYNCDIEQLSEKKEEYTKQILQKIAKLKEVLGINE